MNERRDRLLTVKTVAERLGCSQSLVYNLKASGDLEMISVGLSKGYRVRESALEAFLQRRINAFNAQEV